MNNITQGRGAGPATQPAPPANGAAPGQAATGRGARGGGFANALFAQAAAWAPNPMNPPQYFDLPTKDGVVQPLEIYEGNHTNRVRERFETKVIPFFAQHLNFSISQ